MPCDCVYWCVNKLVNFTWRVPVIIPHPFMVYPSHKYNTCHTPLEVLKLYFGQQPLQLMASYLQVNLCQLKLTCTNLNFLRILCKILYPPLRSIRIHLKRTIGFFTIRMSVRLSERSSYREEQTKNRQKIASSRDWIHDLWIITNPFFYWLW